MLTCDLTSDLSFIGPAIDIKIVSFMILSALKQNMCNPNDINPYGKPTLDTDFSIIFFTNNLQNIVHLVNGQSEAAWVPYDLGPKSPGLP